MNNIIWAFFEDGMFQHLKFILDHDGVPGAEKYFVGLGWSESFIKVAIRRMLIKERKLK